MATKPADFENWRRMIDRPARGLLALHVNPDGDSLASNLALARVLRAHRHEVTIVSGAAPQSSFAFLPGFECIQTRALETVDWRDYDVFWALDMSDPDRSGIPAPFPPGLDVVVIDHHRTNPGWGTVNLVDPGACSTTAVLADLFLRLAEPIDAALATCLLTGIMTDTGFFAFAQGARPFALAAALIERGADQASIRKALERRSSVALTRALGEALATVQVFDAPALAVFSVPWRPDGANPLTTEPGPLIAHANRMGGVDISAVLIEEAPGRVHLELRARRSGLDVAAIALRLGGGGHLAAAGATLTGSLADAIAQLRAATQAARTG